MAHLLTPPLRTFLCPSCDAAHTTRQPGAITPMHPCKGLKGLMAPYVETFGRQELRRGTVAHKVREREDYVGAERGLMRDGDGRVVMAVETHFTTGANDSAVFAPAATL